MACHFIWVWKYLIGHQTILQKCLKNDNIIYIGDLVQKSEGEMLRTPNFGRKSLNEIKEVLQQMELNLGMSVPDWPPENIDELAKKYEDPFNK